MTSTQKHVTTARVSYPKIFRIIFVLFSLYLMGDAFYRWDGFRYYASFSEFLPSVALALILWSIASVITAMLVWMPLRAGEWAFQRIGWKIKSDHILLFIAIFVFLGVLAWIGKQAVIAHYNANYSFKVTLQLKLTISVCIALLSIFMTWMLRNKAARLVEIVQERITPLVWLFGMFVILSLPLVAYHSMWKQTDKAGSQEIVQSHAADKDRPNIIMVIFDALSARDMSVYGYYRPTTPFITEWSKSASLFTKTEAVSNWTTPTTVSMITGKRVWTHRIYTPEDNVTVKNSENIISVLKNNGYYNMAYITNDYASAKKLGIANDVDIAPAWIIPNRSLYEIINVFLYRLFADNIRLYNWILKEDFIIYKFLFVISPKLTTTIVRPEIVFDNFLEVIDNNPPEPYFAWIHLYPPHNPYLPPEPFMGMFDSSPELRDLKSQSLLHAKLTREGYLGKKKYFPPDIQPMVDRFRSRYDEFIKVL